MGMVLLLFDRRAANGQYRRSRAALDSPMPQTIHSLFPGAIQLPLGEAGRMDNSRAAAGVQQGLVLPGPIQTDVAYVLVATIRAMLVNLVLGHLFYCLHKGVDTKKTAAY